ncbi:hypothetical protein [Flavobacterium lindanitolerans]|uniref:Outer membrane lipoprotein-sorting protein n=1 Tax=Flavobacterium lindanitolerans TaxID=428988 RepID=A0A497UW83_9FLAO|nr:hypothetical protein [Flavobacterium lindanitolerans]PKW20952.1 hypothetical protein B0G92_2232 [Flavobacterium lindanitolerans]RLJ30409.1 hypothetical protein CLV50_1818 [Flavobacterium lindanitolerans]
MTTQYLVFIILFALQYTGLNAQTDLQTPLRNEINSKLINNEQYTMDWYTMREDKKIMIAKIFTEIKKSKSEVLITTKVKMVNSTSDWIDSTRAKLPNLLPIAHSSFNGQRDMVLQFGKTITGYYLRKPTNEKTEINEMAEGSYFDSNIYPQLIRWLPLKENYKTSISIFDYNPQAGKGIMKAHIKNTRKDIYKDKDVWTVEVTDDITDNQSTVIFYIDSKTRKLLGQEINMGARKMFMELSAD